MKSKNGILSLCHKKGGGHTLSAEKNNNSHFMETSKWGGGEQCTTCMYCTQCVYKEYNVVRSSTYGWTVLYRETLSLCQRIQQKKKDSTLR